MSQHQKKQSGPFGNPFYLLLVLAGVLFFITAFAYGAMAVRQLHGGPTVAATESDRSFVELLDRHGVRIMVVELIVLSLATVAAITTDGYWSRAVVPQTDVAATMDEAAAGEQEGASI